MTIAEGAPAPSRDDRTPDEVNAGEYQSREGKRQRRREQTQEALFAAAARLLADRGLHGASLDEIAATAGLTKGAVYSNFTSKADLLLTLLDRYAEVDLGVGAYSALGEPRPHAEEGYRRATDAYMQLIDTAEVRRAALLMVEFWLYGMRDDTVATRTADWFHDRRERIADRLETDGTAMPSQDVAILAMAIELGLSFQRMIDPERVPSHLFGTGLRLLAGRAPAT